jgi:hypothetical protein
MAPLTDRSANRQSRIPVVGSESSSKDHVNKENVAPGARLNRLKAPTKSSVARSKSPSPIPIPIVPRTDSATPNRGRLNSVMSNESLNSSFSRRQSLYRPSPTPFHDAVLSRQSQKPAMPIRASHHQSRPSSPTRESSDLSQKRAFHYNPPLPTGAHLLYRPIATYLDQTNTPQSSRKIIETNEFSNIKNAGTTKEGEWPDVTPEKFRSRRNSPALRRTPSRKQKSASNLPRSSSHNSPLLVSPVLTHLSTNFAHSGTRPPVFASNISAASKSESAGMSLVYTDPFEEHPPRHSSLRAPEPQYDDVGLSISSTENSLVENQEHRYLPAAKSFSRPRAHLLEKSSASSLSALVSQGFIRVESPTPVTASPANRSVMDDLEHTHISGVAAPSPTVTNDMLTFAGRRLGNSADLATLDQGGARSTRRTANTGQSSPPEALKLNLHNLPLRVPSPVEANKISPIKFVFEDKTTPSTLEETFEYSRVKKLSGSLLSSSFAGSTLSISSKADQLILGTPEPRAPLLASHSHLATPVDAEFDLPSPSSNGFHVSWPADFGFDLADPDRYSPTVQSSPSVRKESIGFPQTFRRISETGESSSSDSTLYHVGKEKLTFPNYSGESSAPAPRVMRALTGEASLDEQNNHHITTALSILEGAPVKESRQVQAEAFPDFTDGRPKDVKKQQLSGAQSARKFKTSGTLSEARPATASKPLKTRLGMDRLPKATPKDTEGSAVRPVNEQIPSYMLPTPASEARKTLPTLLTDARRNNVCQGSTSQSTGRASQATGFIPISSTDKGRASPSGRQTPVTESPRLPLSGRSTPISDIPRPSPTGRATPSSEMRSTIPTSHPSSSRQVLHQVPAKITVSEQPVASPASQRTPSGPLKAACHVVHDMACDTSPPIPLTRPRSQSKGKFSLNNLKGLFSGKRDVPPTPGTSSRRFSIGSRKSTGVPDVPAMPSLPDTIRKTATKSILVKKAAEEKLQALAIEVPRGASPSLPAPRSKSTARAPPPKNDVNVGSEEKPTRRRKGSKSKITDTASASDAEAEKEKHDTVTLMEMGLSMRQEAFKEDDLVQKERMASFAQVMLDTVTNAVEAERNMYAAMQAAEQAKMSYMMTQQSVQEMNKLVATSRRLPLFKSKKQKAAGT